MKTMNTDEHDELWNLLGKAKKPVVSPFFTRNILREIRLKQPVRGGFFSWTVRKWRFALLAGSLVLLMGIGIVPSVFHKSPSSQPLAQQLAPDYDAINHLDELLAYEESSTWLDNSSY